MSFGYRAQRIWQQHSRPALNYDVSRLINELNPRALGRVLPSTPAGQSQSVVNSKVLKYDMYGSSTNT